MCMSCCTTATCGKMGHSERKGENLYKNIPGNKTQDIFSNAVEYFQCAD